MTLSETSCSLSRHTGRHGGQRGSGDSLLQLPRTSLHLRVCHPEENPLFACTLDTWSSCWTAAFSLCYSDLHWTVHRFGTKSWCVWMEKASVKGLRPARGRVVGLFDLELRLQCSLNGADRRWGHLLSWSASASSSREGAPPHSSQLAAASHPGLEGGIKDGTAEYWKVGACWENAGLHRTLRKISFNLRGKSVYSGSKARSGDPFWGLCTFTLVLFKHTI